MAHRNKMPGNKLAQLAMGAGALYGQAAVCMPTEDMASISRDYPWVEYLKFQETSFQAGALFRHAAGLYEQAQKPEFLKGFGAAIAVLDRAL